MGFEVKANNLYSKSKDYYLLDCDLTKYEKLNDQLCSIPDFDFSSPTIIISEALLVYLEKETTYQLLQNFTKKFKILVFLLSDVVGTNDKFFKGVNKYVGRISKLLDTMSQILQHRKRDYSILDL